MLNKFIHWYNDDFKRTKLYQDMLNLAEDSPWHREHSIGVHTDMVVMEFIRSGGEHGIEDDKYIPHLWVLGLFAAAFHDVGKPGACQFKWKESRGDYKSFNGHEQLSARLWEDWAVKNWSLLRDEFGFEPTDIYRVGYMVEFHKPWDIKRREKLEAMALTLMNLGLGYNETFVDLVKADTWGRISDDWKENRAKVTAWCEEFERRCWSLAGHPLHLNRLAGEMNPEHKPVMYVPIAASGSGKSTVFNNSYDVNNIFSLDLMRTELYGDNYADAFQKSTKDKHFRSTCNERFRELLREKKSLYLDNTNTSRKNRRFYLTEARNRGYHLTALLLPVDFDTVKARQKTRTDKTVPDEAVERQYFGIHLPQYGEFDQVLVLDSNLK